MQGGGGLHYIKKKPLYFSWTKKDEWLITIMNLIGQQGNQRFQVYLAGKANSKPKKDRKRW